MIKKSKKAIGTCLVGVMTVLSAGSAVTSLGEATKVEAAVTPVQAAHNKIEQLRNSLKKNYLGLKNLGTWQTYIRDAKNLTARLPNGSTKNLYYSRIDSAERLVNAAAAVNQLEKSMEVNAHVMRNVPTWINYVDIAIDKLSRVTTEYEDQFYTLYRRLLTASMEIDSIIESSGTNTLDASLASDLRSNRSLQK